MPCHTPKPSRTQEEAAKVENLLKEYHDHKGTYKDYFAGYEILELSGPRTSDLCDILQKVPDITRFSLEMQMWWRDHQAHDIERVEKEFGQLTTGQRMEYYQKLNPYEQNLVTKSSICLEDSYVKFVLYKIGDTPYGTLLTEVKEVVDDCFYKQDFWFEEFRYLKLGLYEGVLSYFHDQHPEDLEFSVKNIKLIHKL